MMAFRCVSFVSLQWQILKVVVTKKNFTFFFLPPLPGSPSLSGTGTVTVLVDDVNDNIPLFTASTFHTTIKEDAPTGTDVLLVNSSDADVGKNGVIRYSNIKCSHFLIM